MCSKEGSYERQKRLVPNTQADGMVPTTDELQADSDQSAQDGQKAPLTHLLQSTGKFGVAQGIVHLPYTGTSTQGVGPKCMHWGRGGENAARQKKKQMEAAG